MISDDKIAAILNRIEFRDCVISGYSRDMTMDMVYTSNHDNICFKYNNNGCRIWILGDGWTIYFRFNQKTTEKTIITIIDDFYAVRKLRVGIVGYYSFDRLETTSDITEEQINEQLSLFMLKIL